MSKVEKMQPGTLWKFTEAKLKQIAPAGTRITNQQIVDAMKAIVRANGQEDGNFDEYAKKYYRAGNEFNIPGLCIENGQVQVEPDEVQEPETTGEEVADDAVEEEDESFARQNTTLGAPLTLAAKGLAKKGQIKETVKTAKSAMQRGLKNAKGAVLKANAQRIRNSAAGKIRDARKAAANLKAEQAKLKELRAQAKAAKGEAKKALQEQINKQMDKVGKARAKNVAAQEAARAAKRQVTKEVNKAAGKEVAKTTGKTVAKTTGKEVAKTAGKTIAKATGKEVAKTTGKALGKSALKKVPLLGLGLGIAFAVDRLTHGDILGAVGEVASGAASCIPGVGTAVSVGIDVALGAKDLHDAKVI